MFAWSLPKNIGAFASERRVGRKDTASADQSSRKEYGWNEFLGNIVTNWWQKTFRAIDY